jgi:branched-chain amino acid transport system ATP-binding protein
VLTVHALTAGYGPQPVLAGAELDVAAGELVTIVGPNGAGKSTLLRAITGLVPARSGRVVFEGRNLTHAAPETIVRAGIVMVPEGRELFGPLTVRENLVLGAWARPRAARRAALAGDLERALALFPLLRPHLARAASTLSGGEQQMLAIARALMARPRLLLLDEPSVGLAPLVVREIFATLSRLKREGLTMLLVEQNARAALRLADRAYALNAGGRLSAAPAAHADTAAAAYGLAETEVRS